MFALDRDLLPWEAELPSLRGTARVHLAVRLAWHLRQRDPQRAAALAAEAASVLDMLPDGARRNAQARFMLVEGEACWLSGQLDAARALADQALVVFDALDDAAGRADARWLGAWIESDRGNSDACDAELAAGAVDARAAGDKLRTDVFDAAAALFAVFCDLRQAMARWGTRFDPDAADLHPAASGWISDFRGIAAFHASDYGRAVSLLTRSYQAAMETGQLRRATSIATNIGNAFTGLNAHHAALEWMQRGLDLARPTGWPMCIGLGLMQSAETLRQLGQRDAAAKLLSEALAAFAPLPNSRAYAITLEYQGDLALDAGDNERALESFRLLEARGDALGQADFRSGARRGQAHALSHLNRPQEALAVAQAALALAREYGDASNQISALRVLAAIHTRHSLPAPEAAAAPSPALHYLQQALDVAAAIAGYAVPGELLDAVAREYAGIGDYAQAYAVALQASAARDQTHSQEATNRAIAMQVQYQTERAETEGEHHRELAAAEAQRAEVLLQTSATLEHLSAIGQEITTHLDAAAVFRALDRHVHGLLDATHFSIFMIAPDGRSLRCAFGIEAGQPLPATQLELSDTHANSVRCVRERREILVEIDAEDSTPNLIPGTLETLSLLFAPLLIGERVLGVMTVQSLAPRAYGERERLIFRTLCAYGAIALDNADAYRQVAATLKALRTTQAQLVEKNLELEEAYKALEDVSLTDQLTGLRNRRFFLQHVDADVGLSMRSYDETRRPSAVERDSPPRDLVFFMVDIDHFKEVNDQHGHASGDAVLVQMQERLREVFRESDYVIRWGGEEFLVLARATYRDDANLVAERIRSAVANRDFELADGTRLKKTCSIGFACFPFMQSQPRLMSWSEVVELADQGLYLAKRSGRNAWAAIYSTPETRPDGLFQRLIHHFDEVLADGEVKLVTNLVSPLVSAGPKKRRLVMQSELKA
ncbi:sensor domain-containing diguanylate cyclase [Massilia sp. RP-1-19]|uniref:diguanylate cyclase n=1 Tax=Massilia polaris TaxID=2728846 RepID=A0A848HSJ7_9BURK|nr:sensor domain-containing diguanylate cyclase [Massilia polaris]NML62711.1 sensor domain-containing diguanylate cyclase [Massilia polaris]